MLWTTLSEINILNIFCTEKTFPLGILIPCLTFVSLILEIAKTYNTKLRTVKHERDPFAKIVTSQANTTK